jgi:hypothetical protein
MKTLQLLICFLAALPAFAQTLNFSSMENGDKVEITLHATGCFLNAKSYYEVRKTAGTSFFTQYAITWDKSDPPKITEKKVIGELQLTQKDIEGLDNFLGYLRGKKETGGTTQFSYQVEYYERGTQIRTESLWDESAGFDMRNRLDVISIQKLTKRFHP